MNRVKTLLYPREVEGERKELKPKYNRAGSLESVQLSNEVFVEHIAYNAKGQRSFVALSNAPVNAPADTPRNGVMTCYAYDLKTFRLKRITSTAFTRIGDGPFRPKPLSTPEDKKRNLLQDFGYDYDLFGNITHIHDRTPESGIPDTIPGTDALDRKFEYDAIYRLVFASGRECDRPEEMPPELFNPTPHCTDVTKTRGYKERYHYDRLGNMKELRHTILTHQINTNRFIRKFDHVSRKNQLKTMTIGQSRSDYAYDNNGNMTDETLSRHFEWDHRDRMKVFRNQTLAADPENDDDFAEPTVYTHYLYDSGGMRVKKLVRKQGGQTEVTEYIDGLFEFQRASSVENNTLHIMDNQTRIATVRVGKPFPHDTTPAIKYHLGDHLGSSNVVVDNDGKLINREEYTPYGETSFGGFGRKRYRFTGKERDEENGLNYHGARYYAAWLGKWTSCDPLGLLEGHNSYLYALANPLRFRDTSGTQPEAQNPDPQLEEVSGVFNYYEGESSDPTHPPKASRQKGGYYKALRSHLVHNIRYASVGVLPLAIETGIFAGTDTSPYLTIAEEVAAYARTNYQGIPPANPEKHARPLLYPEQRKTWETMRKVIDLIETHYKNNGSYLLI
jgi:RHS repeat-associated protein